MIMARMGLSENRCRMIAEYVDAMFICSTAFVLQTEDGRVVILAYRGTEPANFINWLTDADVYPEKVAIPLGRPPATYDVHGGFYRNVRATRHEIVKTLERALSGKSIFESGEPLPHALEALYITGHSLGGAMAAMMAAMLVTEPAYQTLAKKLRAVYTFGQPMIGSPELAEECARDAFLGKRVIRYIYRRDVVPYLPPKDSGPFRHFGPEYRYEEAWPWTLSPQPADQMRNLVGLVEAPVAFLARQLRSLRNVPFQYSLADHAPQHYVSALTPPGISSEFGDP
jgi:Lipase (class 3)